VPAIRAIAFLLLAIAAPAQADLYRWIDPETGSAKFASTPPPWYETGSGPAVERIPFGQPAARPATPEQPAGQLQVQVLEARWRNLLQIVGSLPRQTDFNTANDTVKAQLQAFQSLSSELDRVDPRGSERRAAEALGVMEKMK